MADAIFNMKAVMLVIQNCDPWVNVIDEHATEAISEYEILKRRKQDIERLLSMLVRSDDNPIRIQCLLVLDRINQAMQTSAVTAEINDGADST